jgi:hypothetical protein
VLMPVSVFIVPAAPTQLGAVQFFVRLRTYLETHCALPDLYDTDY